jgi:hypothetical protein
MTFLHQLCAPGYVARGEATRTCVNGTWLGNALTCGRVCSPLLEAPAGAEGAPCSDHTDDDVCQFSCRAGHSRTGGIRGSRA